MSRKAGTPNKSPRPQCFPGVHTFAVVPEVAKTIARLSDNGKRRLDLHLRLETLNWLVQNAPC